MCGRYTLAKPVGAVRERFAIGDALTLEPHYNIAPGTEIVAVTTDREGSPRGELLHWGLVPNWAKDPSVGFKMINARAESLDQKPAYRGPFQRFRCLIPADGFYEWQAREGQPKLPFHVTREDGAIFAFAGLWSVWRRGEPDELRSCTIITTAANERMATVHPRMPVILAPEAEQSWLDASTEPEVLAAMLQGLPAEQTYLRPVSNAVNDARHDGPECLEDAPPPEQPPLQLFS